MSTNETDAAASVETHSFTAIALAASLTVKDVEASKDWYMNVLGFAVDQRYEREGKLRGYAMRAGEVRILLGLDDGAKGWDRVKGEGFSLNFTTEQNIDEVAMRIKENGGKLTTEPMDTPWGNRLMRLEDPDGFRIAISSVRPDQAR